MNEAPILCHDCGAKPGELHDPGCDVERCARCGGQAISCGCIYEVCGMDCSTLEEDYPDVYNNGPTEAMYSRWEAEWGARRLPWTGEWPGVAECREYGFWCRWNGLGWPSPPGGWVRCTAGTPGAQEDLNRLVMECVWDADRGRFVRLRAPAGERAEQ